MADIVLHGLIFFRTSPKFPAIGAATHGLAIHVPSQCESGLGSAFPVPADL